MVALELFNSENHSQAGLASSDAQQRQQENGVNELPAKSRHNTLPLIIKVAGEPMILLLLISPGIY